MQLSNCILSELDIDSTEFFFGKRVNLYTEDDENPYGTVTLDDGHYHLTVGDLPAFGDPIKK
jgi:hypothetical protein